MKIFKIITGYILVDMLFKKSSIFTKLFVYFISVGIILHLTTPFIFNHLSSQALQFSHYYIDSPLSIITDILNFILIMIAQLIYIIFKDVPVFYDILFIPIHSIYEITSNVLTSIPIIGSFFRMLTWNYLYIIFAIWLALSIIKSVFKLAIKISIIALIIVILISFIRQQNIFSKYDKQEYLSVDYFELSDVLVAEYVSSIDGDTIVVEILNQTKQIDLVYISTPQIDDIYGKESLVYNQRLFLAADKVYIQMTNNNQAWVWADSTLAQEAMCVHGFCENFDESVDSVYLPFILAADEYAKLKKLGLYSI